MFPMPELERSVAMPAPYLDKIEPELNRTITFKPQRKANLSELEKMVKEFRREKDYSSAMLVMDTVDGLKPVRSECISVDYKMNRVMEEREAMERDESRKIPESMFKPIEPVPAIEQELDYIRTYGIEWFLHNYKNRAFEGITCLRDVRYLNAQLLHLKEFD